MAFSMSRASLPVFEIGLNALSANLDKGAALAAAKKIDPTVLLNTRLAPDMFPLTRQVQIATDQAKNGSARLAGLEAPKFEDNETTVDQLKARISKTIAFLKTLDARQIDGAADREINFPVGPTRARCAATTTSTTSCCRISTSTSPPPTRSCATAASRSASATSWAPFR